MNTVTRILNRLSVIALILLYVNISFGQKDTGFVAITSGKYIVGKKGNLLNARRLVTIKGFYIAKTETTNAQFEQFILATGYKTDAEKRHDAMVFEPGLAEFRWIKDSTAYWRYPNGITRGDIKNKMNHPVTCISYADAIAYCNWAKVRLPTLVEWEVASRAGSAEDYFWGSDSSRVNKYANVWNGRDHLMADCTDGYMYTAPVASFAPNPWGLYDVYGNVFEFCTGKLRADESKSIVHARGGSWWCSKNSCNFFNSYDIGSMNMHASFSNMGFRVAKD